MKSEFGRGCTYCLGLFLAHTEMRQKFMECQKRTQEIDDAQKTDKPARLAKEEREKMWSEIWFNGSSDHLYDLQIPDGLPKSIMYRLKNFRSKCLHWGHGFDHKCSCNWNDVEWAIQEAKDLLRFIDKNILKVQTSKGDWE